MKVSLHQPVFFVDELGTVTPLERLPVGMNAQRMPLTPLPECPAKVFRWDNMLGFGTGCSFR